MTYSEKLKDPRWQRKRLEILNRDGWTCQLCKDTATELHVHHFKYLKTPWESNPSDLITYCEHCHAIIEFFKKQDIPNKEVDAVYKERGNDKIWILSAYRISGKYVAMFHFNEIDRSLELAVCVHFDYIHRLSNNFLPKNKGNNG